MIKTTFLFLILSVLSVAQETKNYDKLYYSSVATLAGTQALDIYSSVGKYEANPIAQGNNQVFITKRGILIKSAFMLTVIGVERLLFFVRNRTGRKNLLGLTLVRPSLPEVSPDTTLEIQE